jgi:Fe-Mn family superoxide dismutase
MAPNTLRNLTSLIETINKSDIKQASLPYGRNDLEPVKSKETIDYHYGTLYKGYVDRYNAGEGDADFNEAGAFLHNIYFTQLMSPKGSNTPKGASAVLIEKKYGSFSDFQSEVTKVAMGIQGSGWVYMARDGSIKTIKNHAVKKDIALLIDWWEHAWALDYQANKAKYLKNIWRIINWDVIDQRL